MRKMNVFLSTSFICKAQRGQTSNYDADQVVILPQSHPLPPHLQTALWDLLGKRKRPLLSNGEGWADASFLPQAPSLLVMCKGRHCTWWNPAPSPKPTDSGPSVSPRPSLHGAILLLSCPSATPPASAMPQGALAAGTCTLLLPRLPAGGHQPQSTWSLCLCTELQGQVHEGFFFKESWNISNTPLS